MAHGGAVSGARYPWCRAAGLATRLADPVALPANTQQGGSSAMLVLTRKSNQSIMIGDDIEVSVLAIMGEKVRIGIQAPRDVPVFRKEVYLEIQQENLAAGDEGAREEVDAALRKLGES
jgi:carbon storage regulator